MFTGVISLFFILFTKVYSVGLRVCVGAHIHVCIAQSVGTVEYTNHISAEGKDSPNECPLYDTKQSDGEAGVIVYADWNSAEG